MPQQTKQFILLGESPLVTEFGEHCNKFGLKLVCKAENKNISLPDFYHYKKPLPTNAHAGFELSNTDFRAKKKNLFLLEKHLSKKALIFSSSITVTISEQSKWMKYPQRLVGISALPTLLSGKLIEVTSPLSAPIETMLDAKILFELLGKEISVVQDRIGMVMPRILCMVINEAYFACMEDIASPQDIDLAMKIGTNYPEGPIKWSQQISPKQVVAVLDALYRDLGEERYRVAPLLRNLAG